MEKESRQSPVLLASFLAICFLGGLIFSGYYDLSEVDIFSPLCFESPDLSTLATIEKVKINQPVSCFKITFLPVCTSFQIPFLVLPITLGDQINNPIRC
jgi:hypothetical protein